MDKKLHWLTTQQAADELDVSRRQIQSLIDSMRLPAQKMGRDWVVSSNDLAHIRETTFHRPRLTQAQIMDIQRRYTLGERVETIAQDHHVSRVTIYRHLNLKGRK